ncbi:hypothetical protein ACIQAS_16430 [Bacillus safensis]
MTFKIPVDKPYDFLTGGFFIYVNNGDTIFEAVPAIKQSAGTF